MALLTVVTTLVARLRELQQAMVELRLTAVEDRPVDADLAMLDRLEDRLADVEGAVDEALAAAAELLRDGEPFDPAVAGALLATCRRRIDAARLTYWRDVASYDALAGTVAFGHERGGVWRAWVATLRQGLDRCQEPFDDASCAVTDCWAELLERLAHSGLQVRTTSIGQQILRPDPLEASV